MNIDNLEISIEGVSAANIFNYDETNIKDDPSAKKVIVSSGKRRIERNAEHSKQSFSIMFCRNSAGTYLPLFAIRRIDKQAIRFKLLMELLM